MKPNFSTPSSEDVLSNSETTFGKPGSATKSRRISKSLKHTGALNAKQAFRLLRLVLRLTAPHISSALLATLRLVMEEALTGDRSMTGKASTELSELISVLTSGSPTPIGTSGTSNGSDGLGS